MLSKQFIGVALIIISFGIVSCNEEKYQGESMKNYPDLSRIFQENWDIKEPYVYWKVTLDGEKKDSVMVPSTDMPWEEIKSLFSNADINKEELNHHYSIDIMQDSTLNKTTLTYSALAPKDPTRSINIISDGDDKGLTSLYFEMNKTSKVAKVLFIPETLIQIQKRKDAGDILVETYYFPE